MKKLAITLCILGFTSCAFAHIQSEDMSTVQSIKAQGFSEGMSHVTDTVRYNHSNATVEPYYSLNPLGSAKDEKGKWYTIVKRWLDPAQDDELFGRHNITFTNDWFEMESPFGYSQEHKNEAAVEEKKVEDTTVQDSTPVEEIENL